MSKKRDKRPKLKAKRTGVTKAPKMDWSNANRNVKTLRSIEKANNDERMIDFDMIGYCIAT